MLNTKCVFFKFSLQLLSEIFLILRKTQGDIINVHTPSLQVPNFNETWTSAADFGGKKHSNTNFHVNPSSWSRIISCRRTDRYDEVNSHFSQILRGRLKMNETTIMFDSILWPHRTQFWQGLRCSCAFKLLFVHQMHTGRQLIVRDSNEITHYYIYIKYIGKSYNAL